MSTTCGYTSRAEPTRKHIPKPAIQRPNLNKTYNFNASDIKIIEEDSQFDKNRFSGSSSFYRERSNPRNNFKLMNKSSSLSRLNQSTKMRSCSQTKLGISTATTTNKLDCSRRSTFSFDPMRKSII